MKPFIDDDFLLESDVARDLYHRGSRATCRSSTTTATSRPSRSRADHRFRSITEIWLEGDHYKWRAMRANGVPERFCHRRRHGLGEVRGLGAHRSRRRCAIRSTTGRTWS